jgi:carboxypeptidase C (cathepsin A)
VETQHTITLGGETFSYLARTGFIPLLDGEDKIVAQVFYVAYEKESEERAKRPLTFLYNGGPGAASMFLHMGAFGPKVIPRSEDGTGPVPFPYRAVENPNTLLDVTDMVFVDPVGTGFSHAVAGVDPTQFWGEKEDVAAVGKFIQAYLTERQRWVSPIFVIGESYGGVRTAGLGKYLQDAGIPPRGLVLISPVLDMENIQWSSMGDRALVLSIPAYATAAWYHNKIEPGPKTTAEEIHETAWQWSQDEYLNALWKGEALSLQEREGLAARMSNLIGVSSGIITQNNLRLFADDFATELLQAEGRSISVYDVRMTAEGPYTGDENDQTMFTYSGPLKACINDYLQSELGLDVTRPYMSGNAEVYLKWNWQSGREAPVSPDSLNLGYPDERPELAQAIKRSESLKVFIASGLFDLECPYESVLYTINHLGLPPDRRGNISLNTYPGGHMLYFNPQAQEELKHDLARFYKTVLSGASE